MPYRDFAPIETEYDFFLAHSTEMRDGLRTYRRELEGGRPDRDVLRMLDFGCGTGAFTAEFLTILDWPRQHLELTLSEPVASHRMAAVARLERFSDRLIAHAPGLPPEGAPSFDLILSNHVLYYADDLSGCLGRLLGALSPDGLILLAIAGWENVLMKLWKVGFSSVNRPVPYHSAEDVSEVLEQTGTPFRRSSSAYRIDFPDSEENRRKILRFLFGAELDAMPIDRLLGEFDPYLSGDRVTVETCCEHFAIPGARPST